MRVVIGMATMPGREEACEKARESLEGQFDQLYLYANGMATIDLTDNGKFAGLMLEKEPCYYFSCDDDLIYPPDYIKRMIEAIDSTKSIVTCHGRVLLGENVPYYTGHQVYACLGDVTYNGKIQVAGTGVTGFRTDYFNPVHLAVNSNQKMSDLIFSYYAMKEGNDIYMLPHQKGWIKHVDVPVSTSIHTTERVNQQRLTYTANEIYRLWNSKVSTD